MFDEFNKKCAICAAIGALLFFLLSPGVLLTLPACWSSRNQSYQVWAVLRNNSNKCCATSYHAAGVHAIIFGVLLYFICHKVCHE